MDSTLFSAKNAPPDILSLIFDRLEYGKRLSNEWEKLDEGFAQVCRSWRTAALALLLSKTPKHFSSLSWMNLSIILRWITRISPWLLLLDTVDLSVQHISTPRSITLPDGTSTAMLSAHALDHGSFPKSIEMYDDDDCSEEVDSFIERIRQLFPNAQDCSFIVRAGLWAGEEDMCKDLMGIIAPAPRTLIFRDLANEDASSAWDTIEELVLRLTPNDGDDITIGEIADELAPLFSYPFPELTSLTIETGQDMNGNFDMPDDNPFPSLTSLSLKTYCNLDISAIIDDAGENLTSLTLYLSGPIFCSLRGRVFPNLTCVRIRNTAFSTAFNAVEDVVEAAHLPFLIAPNAEHIENCYDPFSFGQCSPFIIPQDHLNPQLRHLIIRKVMPTLGGFQHILARLELKGIGPDEDASNYFDYISMLLTELPVFSTSLRRIDLQKLMVTDGTVSESLRHYKQEIDKSVYDEYRDSLDRPLFSSNRVW
ncbi:hypothetical protein DL89DRAFT_267005 [Linderina pennispora]|uniref:Uncharacterized protein n=1 Tax=Linderina pennispora TaxID=61395 RepID=A0A1Y1WBT7_9FUNG|nr:uncharacterized protein DL89DRAFT_267005 [Linderina pennispora]ORX70902.1 hypothetical protein DL89DRAFT_267005 [Linderina pennispora]